jgi:hypothetical protein
MDITEAFVRAFEKQRGHVPAFDEMVACARLGLSAPPPEVREVEVQPSVPEYFRVRFRQRHHRDPNWSDVLSLAMIGLEPVPPEVKEKPLESLACRCPTCGAHGKDAQVKDSRRTKTWIRRRRICTCGAVFTTVEVCASAD